MKKQNPESVVGEIKQIPKKTIELTGAVACFVCAENNGCPFNGFKAVLTDDEARNARRRELMQVLGVNSNVSDLRVEVQSDEEAFADGIIGEGLDNNSQLNEFAKAEAHELFPEAKRISKKMKVEAIKKAHEPILWTDQKEWTFFEKKPKNQKKENRKPEVAIDKNKNMEIKKVKQIEQKIKQKPVKNVNEAVIDLRAEVEHDFEPILKIFREVKKEIVIFEEKIEDEIEQIPHQIENKIDKVKQEIKGSISQIILPEVVMIPINETSEDENKEQIQSRSETLIDDEVNIKTMPLPDEILSDSINVIELKHMAGQFERKDREAKIYVPKRENHGEEQSVIFNRFSNQPQRIDENESVIERQKDIIDGEFLNNTRNSESRKEEMAKEPDTIEVKKDYLKKYHSAWSNYYKEYYENYYAKNSDKKEYAGRNETENTKKMKALHSKIKQKAKERTEKIKNHRFFIPTIASAIVVALIIVIQYNQVVTGAIAQYISPGYNQNIPIITAVIENQPVTQNDILTIPKIGVEENIDWAPASLNEKDMQAALHNNVVYYPVIGGAKSHPGENGNTVILGHSSGDFFAPGMAKYTFALLHKLDIGDTFYITYNGIRYIYRIDRTEIIEPTDIAKLNVGEDKPYATLVTCTPPGTALQRLLVVAEQISPDPNMAIAPVSTEITGSSSQITGKTPTLFDRIFGN